MPDFPYDDMMSEPNSAHPVPEEQQPLREYEQLRNSAFFRWATLDLGTYVRRIAWVWLAACGLTAPIAADSFSASKQLGHLVLATGGGALLLVSLVVLRLYLGWLYIRRRLYKAAIVYEESGWYDGEIWEKPDEDLAKDRLLVQYQVQPILQRMHRTLVAIGAIAGAGAVLWQLV